MARLSLKLAQIPQESSEGEIAAILAAIPGVVETSANIALERATLVYNERATSIEAIVQAAARAGYLATPMATAIDRAPLSAWRWQSLGAGAIFAGMCLAALPLAFRPSWIELPIIYALAAGVAQFGCGWGLILASWRSIRHGRFSVDLAIVIYTSILFIYATIAGFLPQLLGSEINISARGYYLISTLTIAIALWSKRLEVRSQIKAAKIIDRSVKNSPYSTRIIYERREIFIPLEQVQIGDKIYIKQGEIIPIDGKVIDSFGLNNPLKVGDPIRAGTTVSGGDIVITAVATKHQKLLPIADLSPRSIPAIADRWIGYLFPLNLAIAIATGGFWWLTSARWSSSITLALAIVAISCPSCFALATALGRSIGLIIAAKSGMAVKNGMSLELASRIKTIVCDSSVLLDRGNSIVTDFIPVTNGNRQQEIEVLQLAASLEYHSDRPTARAIVRYASERRLPLLAIEKFQDIINSGSAGIINGKSVRVGTIEWIDASSHIGTVAASNRQILLKYDRQWQMSGKTVVWIEIDGELAGAIAISDEVAAGVRQSIGQLKLLGIEPVLLTASNSESAGRLAKDLGINRIFSGLEQGDRPQIFNRIQAELSPPQLVGSIARNREDRSLSIGIFHPQQTAASDEIEMMNGDLLGIISAIRLSRWTNNAIVQNLSFAVVFSAVSLAMILGWQHLVWESSIDLWLAVIATVTSSIWICANSFRLLARRSN